MFKKIIFIILLIILIGGIAFALMPREQKNNISNTVSNKSNDIR